MEGCGDRHWKGLAVPTRESHIMTQPTDDARREFIANPTNFKVDSAGNQVPFIDRLNERFLKKRIWRLEMISNNVDQKSQNVDLTNFPLIQENEARGDYTVRMDDGQIGPVLVFDCTIDDATSRLPIRINVSVRQCWWQSTASS